MKLLPPHFPGVMILMAIGCVAHAAPKITPSNALAERISREVDARIAGQSFSTAAPLWSTRNDASQTYKWNPDSWLKGVNMTCVSPWNSTGGATRTVTLITPDAVIGANHFSPGVGADVRFVGQDNLYYTRRIVAQANPASDIWVGLLDSPLPSAITPAKSLPKPCPQLPLPNSVRIPVCGLNQQKQAIVCDYNVLTKDGMQSIRVPENLQRRNFFRPLIVGDSGSPYFFIINNQPVLLGCWWSAGGGPSVQHYRNAINDALIMMGSRYKLQAIDLKSSAR